MPPFPETLLVIVLKAQLQQRIQNKNHSRSASLAAFGAAQDVAATVMFFEKLRGRRGYNPFHVFFKNFDVRTHPALLGAVVVAFREYLLGREPGNNLRQ